MSSEIKVTNEEVSRGVIITIVTLIVIFLGHMYLSVFNPLLAHIVIVTPFVLFLRCVFNNKSDVKKWIVDAPISALGTAVGWIIVVILYNLIF